MHPSRLAMLTTFTAVTGALSAQWVPVLENGPARNYPGMVFSPALGQTILFGGDTGVGATSNETWTYDGSHWMQLTPTQSPPARFQTPLSYDLIRGVVVIYGGRSNWLGMPQSDTWEFDGVTWRPVAAQGPGPRQGHGLAFDATRNVTVLYGGLGQGFSWPSETWEFDGANWMQANPANDPGPRDRPAMCHDIANGKTVVFGGSLLAAPFGLANDTWTYDGVDWSQVTFTGPTPPVRMSASLVYDDARQVCLLVGGNGLNGILDDTWQLDLQTMAWTEVATTYTAGVTPRRSTPGVAFDSLRRVAVLYGGVATGGTVLGDTHEFGANSATYGAGCPGSNGTPQLSNSGPPRLGAQFALTLDSLNPNHNFAVLVAGLQEDTITLVGVGMPGCLLQTSADGFFGITGSGGTASLQVMVPNATTLVGAQLFSQALCFDPGVNALGFSLSNAHVATYGL